MSQQNYLVTSSPLFLSYKSQYFQEYLNNRYSEESSIEEIKNIFALKKKIKIKIKKV